MHGIITSESAQDHRHYIKFSCPFVQKSLFQHFSREWFFETGKLHEPFENLSDVFTPNGLNIQNLAKRYQTYLTQVATYKTELTSQ